MDALENFLIQLVWDKGEEIPFRDPRLWRKDLYGNIIYRDAYGDRTHPYGWEKHHRDFRGLGGSDELWNLYPCHWQVNARLQPQSRTLEELLSRWFDGPGK